MVGSQPIAGVPGSLANLTKAGLESVTRALAIEFAAEGIRFNTIAPGAVNTPMNPVEAHEFLRQLSPLKRLFLWLLRPIQPWSPVATRFVPAT